MSIDPEEHMGIAYDIAIKSNYDERTFPVQERISVALLALVVASKTFDPKIGNNFATYATRAIQCDLIKFNMEHCSPGIKLTRQRKIDLQVDNGVDMNYIVDNKSNSLSEAIDDILTRCTEIQKRILRAIFSGRAQQDIAKEIGCTNQNISYHYKSVIRRERALHDCKS